VFFPETLRKIYFLYIFIEHYLFEMDKKIAAAKEKGLQPTVVLSEDPVRFYSNASAPLHVLSNFYESHCVIDDETYPSAEHAYQCLQKIVGSRADWQVGGRFADWDFVYGTVNAERLSQKLKPLSASRWRKKKQIGILAVLVIRRPDLFDVTLVDINSMSVEERRRYDTSSLSYEERWRPIFEAKYLKGREIRSVLVKTYPHPLVEFKRGAHKKILEAFHKNGHSNALAHKAEVWGAYNYGKEIWGQNVTGVNLTRFRDSLKRAPPRPPTSESVPKKAKYKQYMPL